MPKPSPTAEADFELKHRITGAAFLLFFGALFLPWLLGPPSTADKLQAGEISQAEPAASVDDVEEELLVALQQERADEVEQVYISKITPLDAQKDEPQPAQPPEPLVQQQAVQESTEEPEVEAPAVVQTAEESESSEPREAESPVDKPVESTPKIEVGWVVQVGIYTNANGVAKVLADLRSKGFSPSTSVVDTNRGKGTGTRVWLGPFGQRVDAAKSKTRLTERTGEAGFIRAYP